MFRALGVSTAIISLTILAWKGFRFSFGPFLLRVLEELERDYALFFGLIEPLVRGALDLLSVAFSVDLQLFPHWKHCFVLLWLFFGAWTRAAYTNADRNSATFILIWGGLLSVGGGVATGTARIESDAILWWPAAAWVLFWSGFIVFQIGRQSAPSQRVGWMSFVAWAYITYLVVSASVVLVSMSGVINLSNSSIGSISQNLSFPFEPTVSSPGLAWLAVLVTILAGMTLAFGVFTAVSSAVLKLASGNGGCPAVWEKLRDSISVNVGLNMVLSIGGASLLVLLGKAGL